MKIVIGKGINKYKSILFILFMCYEQIIGLLRFVQNIDIWEYFAQALIVLLLVFLFAKSSRKEKFICVCFIICLLVGIFLFPQTPAIISEHGLQRSLQITQGFIGFFIAFICTESPKLTRDLKVVGAILFLYNSWFVLSGRVYSSPNYNAAGYNMAFGFSAMATCLITIYFAFTEKKKIMKLIWTVMSVLLTVYITVLGSRGPLIGVVCIIGLTYLTVYLRDKNVTPIIKTISVLTFSLLLSLFLLIPDFIFEILFTIISGLGFDASHSRTLEHIINGTVTNSSARSAIWAWFSSNLNLLGHGAYSEWHYYGGYAHNFFLDVLFDFGIIFGAIIIICFITMTITTIRKGFSFEGYPLFTIALSYFVGRLLLSSTFWWETYFWMLLGVMVRIIYQSREEKKDISFGHPPKVLQ